jgi:uncharacterized SAM-binding protein YcdF (DUF218 family)
LEARSRYAAAVYLDGRAPRLAFTGGVGDWPPSEAEVGAAVASQLGVPRDVMVLEARSTSTEENARELAAILGPSTRIAVVTDAYHVFRVERVFRRHFDHVEGVGVVSPAAVRARGALREVGAIGWYLLTGRLNQPSRPAPAGP